MFKGMKFSAEWVRRGTSLAVALALIGSVAYLGTHSRKSSQAAGQGTMSVSPSSGSYAPGSTLSVTIRVNSGTDPVNAVQSSLTYNASQLQYQSLAEGGVFTYSAATNTSTAGLVRVARSIPSGGAPVTGDNPVVTVNFKVLASSGTVGVSFDSGYSFIVRSTDNQNILTSVSGGSYTIQSSTATKPILYMTPATGTYAPGSTVSVTLRENGYNNNVTTVQAKVNFPATKLQYLSTSEGGVFPLKARTTAGSGTVDIIRSIEGGSDPVTGDNPVVTLNFRVLDGATGPAAVTYATGSAIYDNSGTGTNILDMSNSKSASYTLATPTPTINSVSPASGSTAGGTVVTIDGSNFVGGASVSFGGSAASNVTVNSSTRITATAPARAAGVVNVSVSQAGSTATKTNAFTYTAPACAAPSTPGKPLQVSSTTSSIILTWSGSTAGSGCTLSGYHVYRNGNFVGNTAGTATNFTDGGLAPNTTYTYHVTAFDNANTSSGNSASTAMATQSSSTGGGGGGSGSNGSGSFSTPKRTVTIKPTPNEGSASLNGSQAEITGNVELSPIVDPDIFTSNPTDSISKVEYYLNNKLVATKKVSPYSYQFDTKKLKNGTYTIKVKTFYTSGLVDENSDKLTVKNKVTLGYLLKHYAFTMILLLLAILVGLWAIWKFLLPRISGGSGDGFVPNPPNNGFGSGGGTTPQFASEPPVVNPAPSQYDIGTTGYQPVSRLVETSPTTVAPTPAAPTPVPVAPAPAPVAEPAPVVPVAAAPPAPGSTISARNNIDISYRS